MEHKVLSLDLLDGHKRNYRSHPPVQIAKLKASLGRFQQVRSIVVAPDPNGRYTILAGHGVVEAARECSLSEINCDVVPEAWSDDERNAYLIADNLHSQDATDDETVLAELLQEQQDAGYDLASLGSSDESLRQMLEALGDGYLGSGERDEEEDELPDEVETRARLGDVWALGRHKIACLNSCNPEQVRRFVGNVAISFVWADPPYGIDMVGRQGWMGYTHPVGGIKNKGKTPDITAKIYPSIIGDGSLDTAIRSFQFCHSTFPKTLQIWWGANYYAHVLPPSSCWIIWDKENTGDFADAELAWCSDKSPVRIFKHMWNGMLKDSEHGQKRVHPSQKPVALAEWAFEKYGKEQDIIFDPFLGSGMSVIAAENLNRTVYGCELSPEYIDVIITRWEKHTGQAAQLLERATEVANA